MCTRGKWLLVGHTGRFFHCWTYFWSRSNEETLIQNNCWINAMVFKINGDSSHFLLNSRRSNTICCLVLNLHYNPDELSKATTTGAFKLDVKWDLITFDKTDKSYSKGESIHTSMIYSECTFFLNWHRAFRVMVHGISSVRCSLPSDGFDLGFNF